MRIFGKSSSFYLLNCNFKHARIKHWWFIIRLFWCKRIIHITWASKKQQCFASFPFLIRSRYVLVLNFKTNPVNRLFLLLYRNEILLFVFIESQWKWWVISVYLLSTVIYIIQVERDNRFNFVSYIVFLSRFIQFCWSTHWNNWKIIAWS